MEAYAGGRQKTRHDNFDDLDLERPEKKRLDVRSQLGADDDEDGIELDDNDLRHRLISPLGQQKKGLGIKINLHTNNRILPEVKASPPAQSPFFQQPPFQLNPSGILPPPGRGLLPAGFTPINKPFTPPQGGFSPIAPMPAAPLKEIDELTKNQKKEIASEKAKIQKELQKILSTEIFHGAGPDRVLYRGLLFKRQLGNSNKQKYTCHVCKITVLDNDIVNHSKGKKHAMNMEGVKIIDYKKEQDEPNVKDRKETEVRLPPVTPGQPIPPGFEENLRRVPLCQSMLDAFGDSPIIGLEYLVELLAPEDENCHVICFLCDKRGESFMQNVRQNIISHMIGTTHRINYLKRHFPRAHEALMKVQNDKVLKLELPRYVRTVVDNIEKAYGRMTPMLVEDNTFRSRIHEYRDSIEKAKHFCEAPGKTFDDCIQIPKRAPSVESLELSPERNSHRRNRSPGRRGRSPAKGVRSRSPGGGWKERRESTDRKRSPFRRKGHTYRSWRNGSHSPEAGSSRVSPTNNRSINAPPTARDGTPTLDEESGQEVVEILQTNKNNGKKMPLSDALRDTTPVSISDSPISLSPDNESRRSPRRHRPIRIKESPPRIDLFGREVDRRREYRHSRSRSPENRHGHRGRRPSRSPRRRQKSISCSPISSRSGSRSPRPVSRTSDTWSHNSSRPLGAREKLDRFKKESDEIERDIKKKRRYYHTQPEKHPAYNEEWKIFWNKKQLEVKEKGRDPTKYDYTPEWKVYWNERVEELYIHEFQERKRELKRKYNYSEEEESKKENRGSRGRASSRGESLSKGGSVSDVKDTWKALTGGDIKEDPKPPEKPEYHTVLGVLRAISVLEPQLGSLGVTINKLLGKAIIMERTLKGSSEDLLVDIENTVLLETVKEKFKGQLMAGIVERFNVYATRNCISNIATVLESAPPPVMKDQIQKADVAPKTAAVSNSASSSTLGANVSTPVVETKKEAVSVPGVGNIDRAAIAMQIASALLAQGKTDVSNEELAQLVEAVVGMAQKQNEEASEQEKKKEDEKISTMEELVASQNEVNPADMSEDDLISCLKIFEFLPEHEKHSIIMQLQRLEETDPEKVKELRKYVNAGSEIEKSPKPFFGKIESDEEDYLDSDVLQAAKNNVEQQTKPKAADSKTVAEATDSMMANLKQKINTRKLEPIDTALPLPPIGVPADSHQSPLSTPMHPATSSSSQLLLPSANSVHMPVSNQLHPSASSQSHPMFGMDMMQHPQQQQFNPYEQQHFPYQYGGQPYNYYQPPRPNWPPVTQLRPGSDTNLISVPLQNLVHTSTPQPAVYQRPKGGAQSHTALIQLVGRKST